MILHPFNSSNFAKSFNKRRFLLNYNIDMISTRTYDLNDGYWNINNREESVCKEDDMKEYRESQNFIDDFEEY